MADEQKKQGKAVSAAAKNLAAKAAAAKSGKSSGRGGLGPDALRKQLIKDEKERINAALKKTARKIMGGGTAVTILALLGLYLLTTGSGTFRGTLGLFFLLVGLLGFGVLGGLVFRMYSSGKEAARLRQQRQRSKLARKDLQHFTEQLSAETREKLMAVSSRSKVAPGSKTAEVMYLQLKGDELSNALQFLCMTSRAGELELKFTNGEGAAQLFLKKGTVVFAKYDTYEGLEAVARMLKAGAADASFYEGRANPGQNLDMPISGILLNASVMGDEM